MGKYLSKNFSEHEFQFDFQISGNAVAEVAGFLLAWSGRKNQSCRELDGDHFYILIIVFGGKKLLDLLLWNFKIFQVIEKLSTEMRNEKVNNLRFFTIVQRILLPKF